MTDTAFQRLFNEEIRAWHGQAPLIRVFWRKGVFASLVLALLYTTTVVLEQTLAEQAMIVVMALYTGWILIAIWRCSSPADTNWRVMTRMLTVAWAGNAAMVLFFRQLELLTRYF